ncbi:DinB family protein [Oceanobacillus luteolus]|uniref:DinB family protein n=1 Tax=Oceanobacillus luteolus TaxID=1274358 RepID=A0ABW4HPZ7_9BACI
MNKPISEGKWTIREIVGHLYYWDKYNLEIMVPKMANGVNLPPFPDHDQHNKEAISYLRDNTVESIIDAFIETRKELIKRISEIEEDARFTIGEGKRQFSCESYKYICKTRHSSFATNTCKIK